MNKLAKLLVMLGVLGTSTVSHALTVIEFNLCAPCLGTDNKQLESEALLIHSLEPDVVLLTEVPSE